MKTNLQPTNLVEAQRHAHTSLQLMQPFFSGKAGGARKNDSDIFVGFMKPDNVYHYGVSIPTEVDTLEVEFSLIANEDIDLSSIHLLSADDLKPKFRLGVAIELLNKEGSENDSLITTIKKNGGCRGAIILIEKLDNTIVDQQPALSLLNAGDVISSGDASLLKYEDPFYIGLEMLRSIKTAGLSNIFPKGNLLLTGAIAGPVKVATIDKNRLVARLSYADLQKDFNLTFQG